MKKYLAILMTLLLLTAMLTGCGAASKEMAAAAPEAMEQYVVEEPAMEEAEVEYATEDAMDFSTTSTSQENGAMSVQEVQTYAEKIIYSGQVYMETTEFDKTVNDLDRAVKEFGGFVQESSVNGDSRHNDDGTTSVINRWGYYTVRIPTDKFDAFMTLTGEFGNVTSSSRTAENVTSQYTDYEARLSSLYTQEERLLAMLEESGDLDSLIQLEARLSEVRYEIESIERNLRNLDQKLAYSTVSLELREVQVYTPTATVQRTYGEKLADAFADGWNYFVRGLQRFTINLAEGLPSLVLFAIVVVVVVLVVRKTIKKRRAKKAAAKAETEE